jgi:hypothetical protein
MIKLAAKPARPYRASSLPSKPVLLILLCAVAHNQNDDQDDSQYTGNYLINQGATHTISPCENDTGCAPRLEQMRATPGANTAKYPTRKTSVRPAKCAIKTPPNKKLCYLTRVRRR